MVSEDITNERILKVFFVIIRFIQLFSSVFVLSVGGQFLNDISNTDLDIPGDYIAIETISGVSAAWTLCTLVIALWGGMMFFAFTSHVDFFVGLAWIAVVILFHGDGTTKCSSFGNKYFWDQATSSYSGINYVHDCHMIRVAFALAILNLILFVVSRILSMAYLVIERRRQHKDGSFCFWRHGILGAVILGNHHHRDEHERCHDEWADGRKSQPHNSE